MFKKLSIRSLRKFIAGKTVLLRADLNTPLKDGEVADSARINASLPTIEYLLQNEAKVIG